MPIPERELQALILLAPHIASNAGHTELAGNALHLSVSHDVDERREFRRQFIVCSIIAARDLPRPLATLSGIPNRRLRQRKNSTN
jgi:hypothetical protein